MAVEKLRFTGEQSSPTPLDDVYAQNPVLAQGEIPDDLVRLRENREFYLSREARPDTQRVENEDYWRVTLPVAPGLPGRSAVRESAEEIASAIDPGVGFSSYRPDWMPLFPTPRPAAAAEPPLLRRFNGKATRPLYVFPPDNRAVYQDASWPWGVVGKIFNSAGFVGSGALIGPRLLVTAGHMVPWAGVSAGNWWMRFVPAYYNGSSLHGAGVESYVSDVRGFNTSDVAGYDFAVCRLYNPLGNQLGYFGYNGYSESWNNQPYWTLAGYPVAVASGQRPSWEGSVSIFDVDGDSNGGSELETRADATGGNSGGPMFGWWNGDARVIGVVSGEETDWIFPFGSEMGNVMASGSGFTNLCAWGRTNWP
ncbi:trypsin-like serine peptidase [Actinoplanes sp. CA-054009]